MIISLIGLRRARAISRPGNIMYFWGSGSGFMVSRVLAGLSSDRSINFHYNYFFVGMARRSSPIQILFLRAPDSCSGSSRLSSVAAWSSGGDAPSSADTAGAVGAAGALCTIR